jgi:hypothetical protein
MVALMTARIPVSQLAALAGMSTTRTFEDLLSYCEVETASDAEIAGAGEVKWL